MSLCAPKVLEARHLLPKGRERGPGESVFKPAGTIQWPMSDIEWQPSGNKNDKDPQAIYEIDDFHQKH